MAMTWPDPPGWAGLGRPLPAGGGRSDTDTDTLHGEYLFQITAFDVLTYYILHEKSGHDKLYYYAKQLMQRST